MHSVGCHLPVEQGSSIVVVVSSTRSDINYLVMDPSHAQLELAASDLAISEPRPCPVDDQASSAGDQAPTAGEQAPTSGDQASSADDQTDGRYAFIQHWQLAVFINLIVNCRF